MQDESAALTEWQRGYLDGMWAYAWWKDGTAYVGTTGTTYKRAATVVYSQAALGEDPE